jgi:hypothetical protein
VPVPVPAVAKAPAAVQASTATPPFPADPAYVTRLSRPVSHTFRAHDGLELSGWLYRPFGVQDLLPTFVYFHGGPEWQERPIFNPLFQALLARGNRGVRPRMCGVFYRLRALLRGGRRPGTALRRHPGRGGMRRLPRPGRHTPTRVGSVSAAVPTAVYLTLAALVTHPELFCVGVDICGIADFETFYTHTENRGSPRRR